MIDRLIRAALRRGWQRGVLDGSPAWIVVAAAALLAFLGRRALRREPEVVFSEKLPPGRSLRITHDPLP